MAQRPDAHRGRVQPSGDATLLDRARSGDLAATGQLYDRHAARIYSLAFLVTKNQRLAEMSVVQGFREAAASTSGAADRADHLLARATLAACPSAQTRSSRSIHLLALTLHGDHTLHEAAVVLGLEPDEAARCLNEALRGACARGNEDPGHPDPGHVHPAARPSPGDGA